MNTKLAAVGVGVALLIGGVGYTLGTTGYLSFILGSKHSEEDRERESRLHSNFVPSANEVKKLVRSLTEVHDKMIKGDREASQLQNAISEDIAARFEKFDAEDWRDRRNFQSMMTFVLVGGKPEIIGNFLKANVATQQERVLAKGVLSFALNRPATALKLLGNVDPRLIERPLAAPLSLALASLTISDDLEKGLELFDEARLESTATAIEEAAMRREVPVLLKKGLVSRAIYLTGRYVRCFGRSVHSPAFYDDFGAGLASTDIGPPKPLLASFVASLEAVDPDIKCQVLLAIARKALLAGKIELAKEAATMASAFPAKNPDAAARAKLFIAAADAPSEQARSALAMLNAISGESLAHDDVEIRDAAVRIAKSVIGTEPQETADAEHAPSTGTGDTGPQPASEPRDTPAIIDRVGKALKQVDGILSGEKK